MGQEYYLMKTFKIAAATAILALASGYAMAAAPSTTGSAATADTTADYHISAILEIGTSIMPLIFPDIIAVVSGGADNTVTVTTDGNVAYSSADASPNGVTSGAVSTTDAQNSGTPVLTGQVGSFGVTGEPNYQFSTSLAPTVPGGASGVSIAVAPASGNTTLDAAGNATITFGGTLTIDDTASAASGTQQIDIAITVAYN